MPNSSWKSANWKSLSLTICKIVCRTMSFQMACVIRRNEATTDKRHYPIIVSYRDRIVSKSERYWLAFLHRIYRNCGILLENCIFVSFQNGCYIILYKVFGYSIMKWDSLHSKINMQGVPTCRVLKFVLYA